MQKIICTFIFVGALFVLGIAAAQPMSSATKPAPTVAPMPAVTPVAKPAQPVVPVMAAPAMATTPVAAPAVEPEMASTIAVPTPEKPKTETPVWKTAGFWIGVVGGPLLTIILAVLVAFGVIRKKWLDYLREKEIIKIADKVVTNIEAYAKSTEAKWDDIVAQALKAVVIRVGELTEEEKKVVERVVNDRAEQAKTSSEG